MNSVSLLRKLVIWRVLTSSLSIECSERRPRKPMFFKKWLCQLLMEFLMAIMEQFSAMVRQAQANRLPWRVEVSMTLILKGWFLALSSIYSVKSLQPTQPLSSTSSAAILKFTWKRFVIYLMVSNQSVDMKKPVFWSVLIIIIAKKTNLQVKDDKTRGLYV